MDGIEFEKAIITVLQEQNQLRGYALFGWKLPLEVDGLLLLEPGIFVCYEAKNYRGVWTGDVNSRWRCGNDLINSNGRNPNDQVERYALKIKDRIRKIDTIQECLRNESNNRRLDKFPHVCGLIVVPDEAQIEIIDAHVDKINQDTIYSRSIHICHLSKLVKVLLELRPYNSSVPELIQRAGGLQYITGKLIRNLREIEQINNTSNPLKILIRPGLFGQDREPVFDPPPSERETRINVDSPPTPPPSESGNGDSHKPENKPVPTSPRSSWSRLIWIVIFAVFGLLVSFVGFKYYQFINRPRLTKSELKIGILTKPEAYSALATYLEENMRVSTL